MTQSEALTVLKSGRNVFLTGEPGAGKTHTINLFKEYLIEKFRTPAITASTGIAATHINGTTIHSFAGIGIKENLTDKDIELIMEKPWVVRRVLSADTLVIDEISMLDANTLNNIDRVLRRIRNVLNNAPFGGMQVVFVGDFFQLPPVAKDNKKVSFAFESQAWKDADPIVCYLTEQHRTEDPEFLEILTAMRAGTISKAHIDRLIETSVGEVKPTRLYTHNRDVDHMNTHMLARIDEPEVVYHMTESGVPFVVQMLKRSCLSPERLVLKVGAVVMFTRNKFDEDTGEAVYVNGTIGTVIQFHYDGFPVVQTVAGDVIIVRQAEWSIEEGPKKVGLIRQFPLRLAWAVTVHKSQGMSLDEATMDLSHSFEYGQGYVALSRVRSLKGLHLEGMNKRALEMHPAIVKQDAIFRELSGKQHSV